MEHLILFHALADTLSNTEFDCFVNKLYKHLPKKKIISALFYLFYHEQKQQINTSLHAVTDIIETIVNTRPNASIFPLSHNKTLSLTDLPSDVINKFSSYLPINSYSKFQRTNRSIFLFCNNPIPIKGLTTNAFINYHKHHLNYTDKPLLKLSDFSQITHISIPMPEFCLIELLQNISLSKHIQTLTLRDINEITLNTFLNKQYINFNNINQLMISDYYPVSEANLDDYVNTFYDLLYNSPNLHFLQLKHIPFALYPNTVIKLQHLLENPISNIVLNDIKAFSFYGQHHADLGLYNLLLQYFSDKLVSFHIDTVITAPVNGFGNLEELCVYNATYDKVNNIIWTANRLKRIYLHIMDDSVEDGKLNDILKRLFSQKRLESIKIVIGNKINRILDAFDMSEFEKRDEFRFEIVTDCRFVVSDLVAFVMKIKGFAAQYIVKWTQLKRNTSNETVVKNTNCTLNGYHMKWLYPCVCNV
eukprot:221701_1